MRKPLALAFATVALALIGAPAARAHEFWLEPKTFSPQVGQSVAINIFIGEHFKGNSYPYGKDEFNKFVVIDAKGERPVRGIDGDEPAVTMKFTTPGLAILAHYSTPETLKLDWERFNYYLKLEGLDRIEARHRARNKPMVGITEIYSRCAKLLMSVGAPGGGDRFTGMPLELVAEKNPFTLPPGEALPVRLLFNGKPIADIQIAATAKAAPDKRQLVRTDAEGRAKIDLSIAAGPWLLNAVHMMEPPEGMKADWTSLWASMAFARP
ncbi:MAG: DUF4198 domain-containing protein [Proteobacteria bacterium]|nr:DUF4198 domain-containing protein [Pseudomonadota bacterium]